MDELQNELLNIYLQNLNFLEENFPEIFKKIVTLEEAINNSKYKQRWSLEYKNDKYFDLKYIENDSYFYNQDSFEYSQEIASNATMDIQDSFSMLYRKDNKLSYDNHHKKVQNIIKHINNTVDFENIKFRTINKYVFFGSGLGLHVDYIFDKIKPLNTYIVEPDIEVFRLSMFITNYSNFHFDDHKLFLSVGDDEKDRRDSFGKFYNYHPYMNYYIKYNLLTKNYQYLFDEVLNFLSLQPLRHMLIDFDFTTIERTIDLYKKKYKFITAQNSEKDFLKDEENPCLVLAGGPSLEKNLDWVKSVQDKVYIIAVNLITPKLLNMGIKPDLVVAIDPNQYVYEIMEKLDKDILKELVVLGSSHLESRAIELFSKENIFIAQALVLFTKLGDIVAGDNVGSIALSIAILLKFKTIYTLGNDAAYDEESGKFYSSGAMFANITTLENMQKSSSKDSVTFKDIIKVKGNLRDKVSTTRKFLNFRDSAEEVTKTYIDRWEYDTKLYNLSDGAYTRGLTPLKIDDINLDGIGSKDSKKLYDALDQFSVDDFENRFKHDIQLIKFVLLKIENSKTKDAKDINEFLKIKLDLITTTLKIMESADIFVYKFFTRILMIIDNYVNFYLSLDDEKEIQDIETMKKLWLDTLEDILKELYNILEKDI